jgi:hypothetical protein
MCRRLDFVSDLKQKHTHLAPIDKASPRLQIETRSSLQYVAFK